MSFYRRRLPHWVPEGANIFLTWRLAGSEPVRPEFLVEPTHWADGRRQKSIVCTTFAIPDTDSGSAGELGTASGPLWLQDPRVANVVVGAIQYGESVRQFYHLHAWVVMSNHVHLIFQPVIEMSSIMRWLKGVTARRANRILGRTGMMFWQDESFDHWIRSEEELGALIFYVESNPVKAGLVGEACQWPWSSAGDGRRQKAIVCPTFTTVVG
jgi:putative transposase